MINSDGGSTDGTPDLIRDATFTEADMVQTSHPLRTLHRVVAPYHGLPGKHTALRTVFAAGELTQAKVLVVIDPSGPATTAERVTELIGPVARSTSSSCAALSPPSSRRRPHHAARTALVRALYGVALDEPLGAEFACSGRFASHCLEQDIWSRGGEVRDRSVASHRGPGQAVPGRSDLASGDDGRRRADHAARGGAPGGALADREPSRARVVLAESRRHRRIAHLGHDRSWRPTPPRGTIRPWPSTPVTTSSRSSRCSRSVLEPDLFARLMDDGPGLRLDDELWVERICSPPRSARAHQHRASGRHVCAALYVARLGVHVAHRI